MKKKSFWAKILGSIAAITAAGVLSQNHTGHSKPPKPPPPPSEQLQTMWKSTCLAVFLENRHREATDDEISGCVNVARAGGQVIDLRAWVDALPADPVPPPPPAPVRTRIRTDGRFFVNDEGIFRPVFASALAILSKSPEQRAAVMDEDVTIGFNGIRVFGGSLTWAGQSDGSAREAFGPLLQEARDKGLYVYISAVTDSGAGYDVESHLRFMAGVCEQFANCLFEVANEFYHPSQSKRVNDPAWLRDLARRAIPIGLPWALGAAAVDEGEDYPGFGGSFVTAHLDRGRDKWNQVRRVREIAGLSEAGRIPAMSGEPIGAAEASVAGRRESDPSFYFALGALSRLFEVGTVFHSDDGLAANLLGPNQRRCAEEFVAGFKSIETDARLTYKNSGWGDSPVEKFDHAVRAYSGVTGNDGWTVVVAAEPGTSITWKNGWSQRAVVTERPGVRVLRIGR